MNARHNPPLKLGRWWPRFLLSAAGSLLGLVLATALALWLWAGREGSLPTTLSWVTSWSESHPSTFGTLKVSDASGSLRGGGHIGALNWSHDGLSVQARGVTLGWSDAALWGVLQGHGAQGLSLAVNTLEVVNRRPPSEPTPPSPVTLPLSLELAFSVETLRYGRDLETPSVSLDHLRGRYHYGSQANGEPAHTVRLDEVRIAQGHYQGDAVIGATAPMPLSLKLGGTVDVQRSDGRPLTLTAQATLTGTLAERDARLQARLRLDPTGTRTDVRLDATAELVPWAGLAQPVRTLDLDAQGLDLALFWPGAPHTRISGTATARTEGDAWHAQVDLSNTVSGPWDRGTLPLDRLQADLTQTADRWSLERLNATLGGGHLEAQGHVSTDASGTVSMSTLRGQAELRLNAIDPSRLWTALASQRVDGSLRAGMPQPGAIAFDIDLRPQGTNDRSSQRLRLLGPTQAKGDWRADGQILTLDTARIRVADAQLDIRGEADLAQHRLQGEARLATPGLNVQLTGRQRQAADQGQLSVDLSDARALQNWVNQLREAPLIGPALQKAFAAAGPQPTLSGSAQARLQWQGGWPLTGAATAWAPDTAAWPRIDARIDSGTLRLQRPDNPELTLSGLSVQAQGPLDRMHLQWEGRAGQGPWTLATAGQAHWPQGEPTPAQPLAWPPPSGQMSVDRLRVDHTPSLGADGTAAVGLPPATWTLAAPVTGRWRVTTGAQWQAEVDGGQIDWQWTGRTPGGNTPLAPARLRWDTLRWDAGLLITQGRLEGLSLPWMETLAVAYGQPSGTLTRAGIGGDLSLGADWDLRLPLATRAPWQVNASLHRTGGDLRLQADVVTGASERNGSAVPAQVRDLRLALTVKDAQANATLHWDSERLGQVTAEVNTRLDANASTPLAAFSPSAPLRGSLNARMPQVGVWSALAPPGWRVRGALGAQVQLGGTLGEPDWRGQLQADEVAVTSLVEGISFSNGTLRATADGQHLSIDRFRLEGPRGAAEGGSFEASGEARWLTGQGGMGGRDGAGHLLWPSISLQAKADRLRVSNRPDRRLVLSGQARARLQGRQLEVRGDLQADEALFLLPDEFTPSLSADVVVRGGRRPATPTEAGQQVQTDARLTLNLGDHFDVQGRGLQARLGGRLEVRTTPAEPAPQVSGEVSVTKGSYRAYGQQLSIESGALRFNGPYDNPVLDIVAVRPQGNSDQRVGVRVSGSAQTPVVRLFADPDMPDGDKLAWLVLGRPATGSGAEAAILQQAALALLSSRGQDRGEQLAQRLGLDDISVRGQTQNTDGTVNAAALSFGKRLSSQLYVSYERSLAGTLGTVSLFYDLTRFITLRGRAGEENAVDLIFTRRYD